MEHVEIEAVYWKRFTTTNFLINSKICGGIHLFSFENKTVSIQLPGLDEISEKFEARLRRHSWREENGEIINLELWVEEVDIKVFFNEKVNIPKEILSLPNNQCEKLSKTEQKHLDKISIENSLIAEKAYEVWTKILRWKTDNAYINRI